MIDKLFLLSTTSRHANFLLVILFTDATLLKIRWEAKSTELGNQKVKKKKTFCDYIGTKSKLLGCRIIKYLGEQDHEPAAGTDSVHGFMKFLEWWQTQNPKEICSFESLYIYIG